MAQFPDVLDYGGRPSLRSNRLDAPGSGSTQSADALATAANTFAAVLEERQAKEDSLNYALARNEMQAADLLEREKLTDDQDYATHDERYSSGFKTAREAISAKYQLSNHDSAILDAETNLIGVRGSVAVRENARTLEVDEGYARLIDGMEIARENLVNAEPESRNAIVEGQLDAINAARDAGFIATETDAERMRQKLTQDFALASIEAMPVEEQIIVLKESLGRRKSYGKKQRKLDSGVGPVSADDIRSGKGSGSIADFLHADTAARMLQTAMAKGKLTRDRSAAFDIVADAVELFPEDPTARMRYIREHSKGDADVMDIAVRSGRSRNEEERIADSQEAKGIMNSATELMETGVPHPTIAGELVPYSYDMIEGENLAKLSPQQRTTLKIWQRMVGEGKDFADSTDWNKWGEWQEMTPKEKAAEELGSAEWRTVVDRATWESMQLEQKRERDAIASAGAKPTTLDTGLTNDQMLTATLVRLGIVPGTGRDDDENQQYQNARWRLNEAVTNKSAELGRKLTPQERATEVTRIVTPMAYTDRDFFMSDYDPEEKKRVVGMTQKELNKAFLALPPIEQQHMRVAGIDITIEDYLVQYAKRIGVRGEVDRDDLERAYFALENNLGDAEVERRLRGN